jgi:uncharacterized membrane protein
VRARFQEPQRDAGPATTVLALVADDPQHPPLYFLLQRAWRIFGDSIAVRRSLAVLFGLALLPAMWWLAAELYDRTVAAVTVAVVAVSPFHVLYAQYDREYSLWSLLTALASGCLCRALRRRSGAAWTAYGGAVAAGLYTDPFFLLVIVAHVAYVAHRARAAAATPYRAFGIVAACALGVYGPWLAVMVAERHVVTTTTQWYAVALPPALLASKWAFEVAAVFFDADYASTRLVALAALVLLFVAAAFVQSGRRAERDRAFFAAALVGSSALPLVLGDLLLYQSRSTASRYLAPAWLGAELLVAAAIVAWTRSDRAWPRTFAAASFAFLIALGGASLSVSSGKTAWWIDSHDAPLVTIARELDERPGATLCSVDDDESILVLANRVRSGVRLTRTLAPGCLAIATASAIRSLGRPAFRWNRVRVASAGDDPSTAFHAQTSRAHGLVFEEPELWYAIARSRR